MERTKESTSEGLTRFSFTVGDAQADRMEKAILDIIIRKPKKEDHPLYTAEEVLGQFTPGVILQGLKVLRKSNSLM